MVLNGFNSDDYIYLEVLNEDVFEYLIHSHKKSEAIYCAKNGDIIRIKKRFLRWVIWQDYDFCKQLEKISRDNADPNAIMPTDLYSKVTFRITGKPCAHVNRFIWNPEVAYVEIRLDSRDNLLVTPWLKEKMESTERYRAMGFDSTNIYEYNKEKYSMLENGEREIRWFKQKEILALPQSTNSELLTKISSDKNIADYTIGLDLLKLKSAIRFTISLKDGEELDFNDPGVMMAFLDQKWLRALSGARILDEEEKLEHFKKDFENRLPSGRLYFRLNDEIQIDDIDFYSFGRVDKEKYKSIPKEFNFSVFCEIDDNVFNTNRYIDYDKDENGNIRYIWADGSLQEQELSKIGVPLPYEEARKHYIYERKGLIVHNRYERARDYACHNHKAFKKAQKKNPDITPMEFKKQHKEMLKTQAYYLHLRLINALKQREQTLREDGTSYERKRQP